MTGTTSSGTGSADMTPSDRPVTLPPGLNPLAEPFVPLGLCASNAELLNGLSNTDESIYTKELPLDFLDCAGSAPVLGITDELLADLRTRKDGSIQMSGSDSEDRPAYLPGLETEEEMDCGGLPYNVTETNVLDHSASVTAPPSFATSMPRAAERGRVSV